MAKKGKKEIEAYIKLQIPAGEANPSPPVGPALGQHGLNIQEFCKSFNGKTEKIEKGLKVPVIISVYNDKSFDFVIKTTPAAILLRKAAGIEKGSGTPNSVKVGSVTLQQVEDIAKALKISPMRVQEIMDQMMRMGEITKVGDTFTYGKCEVAT